MALYLGSDRVCTTIENLSPNIPLEVSAQGVLQKPTTSFTWKSQGSDVGDYALYYAFRGWTGLTSVDLSSLTSINGDNALGYAFYNCINMTSINLSNLEILSGSNSLFYAFSNTSLTNLSFPSLKSSSFTRYTNQFSGMLNAVTGCTVHFPSNLQSISEIWAGVNNGFGGTNTTILFDLPATT